MKKETLSIIGLLIVCFIWGSAFLAVDMAINAGWQTFSILTVRGLLGGLLTLPFAIKNKFWKNKKGLLYGFIMGIFFFGGFYFQTEGQSLSSIVNAAFLTVLYVVFAPIILRLFFKEKQERKVYIGCLLSLIGVFFLTIMTSDDKLSVNIGDILVIIGALFFALQIITAQKSAKYCEASSSTTVMLLTMGILSLILMFVTKEDGIKFDISILPVLYCAVFSSAIASFVQVAAQRNLDSSKASIIMSQEVLIATVLSYIVDKEFPSIYIFIGATIMLTSILIIEVSFKKKLKLNKYKYILLDVDDTLLDFQKSQNESIKNAFKKYNIELTEEMYNKYKEINTLLWKEFELSKITTKEIYETRFQKLIDIYNLNCIGIDIENDFRKYLDTSYYFIDKALDFINKIKDNYILIIVTNGKKETQKSRLKLSGLDQYFKYIFISEEVGFKKPEVEFFDKITKEITGFNKKEAIIIGDSITSDIQGGKNFNIKTCLYNPTNIKNTANYSITNFEEIIL